MVNPRSLDGGEMSLEVLPDYVVLRKICERLEERKRREQEHPKSKTKDKMRYSRRFERRDWVETMVHQHIGTISGALEPHQVDEFYSSLKKDPGFQNLMPAEVVHLINHRPSNEVILQVLIEQCSSRLTPDMEKDLLALIGEKLGPSPLDNLVDQDE